MKIERVDRLDQLDLLEADWERVYADDDRAHVFVSFAWLRSWFEIAPHPWMVLVARTDQGDCAGFLPLSSRAQEMRGVEVVRELHMAGKPFGPLTGFVVDPDGSRQVLAAFAGYVQSALAWESFRLDEVMDDRLEGFLGHFEAGGYEIERGEPLCCPYLPLPDSWDAYLQDFMSHKGRFNLRRSLRQVEALDGFRVTGPETDPVREQIDVLMELWQSKWGPLEPHELATYRHMYTRAFENGGLWLKLLWNGDVPIGGLAAYLDPVRSAVAYYTSGYDPAFQKLSPGKLVVGYAIRDCIGRGLRIFDFLVGGHDYKLSFFGAQERYAASAVIRRSGLRSTAGRMLLGARDALRRVRGR